jgi:glycosyltransferase involved in cell wall biosynthesis
LNPSDRLPGISVFLPAHNEAPNLDRVVRGFLSVLPALADSYEVIVVDDGSTDDTPAVVARLQAADAHVRSVRHNANQGYGGAVISGIRAATMPWLVLCDGDGQFDPNDLGRLVARADNSDAVIGRRARRADSLMRRINGRAWTVLMRLLFGVRTSDVDCGFKLLRKSMVNPEALRARGAMISTELVARLAGRGARIAEVDVAHLPRVAGEQSGATLGVIARAFREMFVLFGELREERRRASRGNSEPRRPPDR